MALSADEQRRRRGDARPDPAAELVTHPRGDLPGAPVGVEAGHVEAQALRACPQMRVLQPAGIGEQRVVERPEGSLQGGGLGRARRRVGARMARADGEVAERDAQLQRAQARFDRRAERALVVAVDDDGPRVGGPPDVVVWAERVQRGAAEVAQWPLSASKIRFAPGRSLGDGAS